MNLTLDDQRFLAELTRKVLHAVGLADSEAQQLLGWNDDRLHNWFSRAQREQLTGRQNLAVAAPVLKLCADLLGSGAIGYWTSPSIKLRDRAGEPQLRSAQSLALAGEVAEAQRILVEQPPERMELEQVAMLELNTLQFVLGVLRAQGDIPGPVAKKLVELIEDLQKPTITR